jgi:hypothetical protein
MLKFCSPIFFILISINAVAQITSDLPIVIINTLGEAINDEPGVIVDFKIINNPSGVNSELDTPNEYNGKAKAEFRGCTSQSYPKKSFGIELRSSEDTEEDLDRSLFGFPSESDWVLNASYTDKTFLREVLGFELFTLLGRYSSRTKFVELILNGVYHGLYVFQEKVKRDSGRVPISSLSNSDTELPKISGGYLLKIDKDCGDPEQGWLSKYDSPNGTPGRKHDWKLEYPNDRNVNSQQFGYIKSYIDGFEDVMAGPNACHAVSGYRSFIDVDSFIDYFLLQEVVSNNDAFRFSTFFYKNRNDDLLYAGPGWDFNLSAGFLQGVIPGNHLVHEGWRYTDRGDPAFPVPFFWFKLLGCDDFRQQLILRYKALRQTVWTTQALVSLLESKYQEINNSGAYARNFVRWPILNTSVWVNSYVGATVQDEKEYMKNWLTSRLLWMDANISSIASDAMPVTLRSIAVSLVEQSVHVEWETSLESNASHFEIERARNGLQFQSVGSVEAMGDFSGIERYEFFDAKAPEGLIYYRLKLVDRDSSFTFSEMKSVVNVSEEATDVFVSPNPARELLKVNATWQKYEIFDSSGRVVQSEEAPSSSSDPINVSELTPGVHVLQLHTEGRSPRLVRFVVE